MPEKRGEGVTVAAFGYGDDELGQGLPVPRHNRAAKGGCRHAPKRTTPPDGVSDRGALAALPGDIHGLSTASPAGRIMSAGLEPV
jgi:hypothetical protein